MGTGGVDGVVALQGKGGIGVGVVGERVELEDRLADGVDAVGRNQVAGKRIAGGGVLNNDQGAVGREAARKIAGALQSGGHLDVVGTEGDQLACVFLGGEEEELVAKGGHRGDHGSADAEAGHVEAVAGAGKAVGVVEEVVGVELLVAVGPPGAAVELGTAAAGYNADGTPGVPAVFGLIIGRKDLDFGDGIHVGLEVDSVAAAGVDGAHAVHGEILGFVAAAIDDDAGEGVGGGGVATCGGNVDDAGEEAGQGEEVAAFEGEGFELFARDRARAFPRGCLERCNGVSDCDGLRDGADGQLKAAEVANVTAADVDACAGVLLKPGGLDGKAVIAGRDRREVEASGCVGGGLDGDAGGRVRQNGLGGGDGRVVGIDDEGLDGPCGVLG